MTKCDGQVYAQASAIVLHKVSRLSLSYQSQGHFGIVDNLELVKFF